MENITENNGAPQQPEEKKGFAIASMILGIVAIVLGACFWYISVPCGIVGLILGVISNKASKNGMAIAGIVLSIISLVWVVLIFAGLGALLGLGAVSA